MRERRHEPGRSRGRGGRRDRQQQGRGHQMVTVLFGLIRHGLKRGEKVAISGFGSFETARREAREGRNPRTGEPVRVAASTTAKFKPGKGRKDAPNGGA